MNQYLDSPSGRAIHVLGTTFAGYAAFWAAILLGILVVSTVGTATFGEVTDSLWEGQTQLTAWVLFAGGIVTTASFLPMLIAHGLTRRDILRGATVAVLAAAVVAGVAATAVFGVERIIFSVADWPHVLSEPADTHVFDRLDQWGLMVLELTLTYGAFAVSGMLVGAGYMRLGWVLGTVFVVPAMVPLASTSVVFRDSWIGGSVAEWLGFGSVPIGLAVLIAAGTIAMGSWISYLLLRDVPLDPDDVAWSR